MSVAAWYGGEDPGNRVRYGTEAGVYCRRCAFLGSLFREEDGSYICSRCRDGTPRR
jgi:hypothetical protein